MKKFFVYAIAMLLAVTLGVVACQKDSAENQPVKVETKDSSTVQDRAVPPTTGWASQTGYLNDDLTNIQTTILALAAGYSGQSSGQSATGTVHLTDCAGGDGTRIRNAIQDYHNWFTSPPVKNACNFPSVPSSVITSMNNKLFNLNSNGNCINGITGYCEPTDRTKLVNWIIACYNTKKCANPNSFTIPTNDNQTLLFLGIRKQCLEWACTLAGTPVGYSGPFITNQTSFRRGMGLYEYNSNGTGKHAMIITDIYWTVTNGVTKATKFKVAESNWASGWHNPNGAIPWQRTIAIGRILTYTGSPSMKVVSFG